MTPPATPRSPLGSAPAITLNLRPRPSDLPALACVQTRAFGMAQRVRVPGSRGRAAAWRAAVDAWVLLGSWPTLIMLCCSNAFGWVAASGSHAVAELRPMHRTRGELLKLVALAVVLGAPMIVVPLMTFLVPVTLLAVRTGHAWCGRAVFLPVVGSTCCGVVQSMLPQSTLDSSRSLTPIRTTGTVRLSSCFSIVGPQSFAVETMIRLVNTLLLDAARKESTSPLATWWVGS